MFLLHPVLGWLTVAFMIILLAFAFFALRKTMQVNDASLEDEKELNDFIHNKLRNAEVIEAQGMVPNLQRQWWKRQVELAKLQHESLDLEERVTSTSKQLKFAMNSLGLGVGALLAMQGELTMGAMIAASMLMSRATAPIDNLVFGWKGLLTARMAFERIEALLTQYAGKASDLPKRTAKGFGFELQNVDAHVGSSSQPVLKGLSLSIPQGSCTVVLGASGAGKSTLARLLVGISQPSQGSVLMGGVNLNELNRNALAPDLGYLPQEVELFADTMANNMARLGEPDSNKVIAAAKAVGIHEFILSLPKGYDTIIGEVGGVLSGGQRQRIALARAVYGFPRLLVLDEPNASLDETGETALSALIQGLKAQGVTIVLISHRPAVVQQADNVLVLENGQTQFWGPLAAYTGRGQASSPSPLA
jgi:ATP-binding cassette subfamily C exporter for protease/lipase